MKSESPPFCKRMKEVSGRIQSFRVWYASTKESFHVPRLFPMIGGLRGCEREEINWAGPEIGLGG